MNFGVAGTWAVQLAEVAAQEAAPVALLALLEHPWVRAGEGRAAWLAVHSALFANVRSGAHIRIPDAGHNIHAEQPARVAAGVEQVLESLN